MNEMKVLCIIGASGSGKSTIAGELHKMGIPSVVSHRTRPIRSGETHGVDGYFIKDDVFEEYEGRDAFCAKTVYDGHKYALGWKELEHFRMLKKRAVCYVVDAPGYESLSQEIERAGRRDEYDVIAVGVMADPDDMEKRLLARGDDVEKIKSRVARMGRDIRDMLQVADYVVVNDTGKLGRAVSEIRGLV